MPRKITKRGNYQEGKANGYQNIEGMDKIREQTRKRVAKHREKQKLLQCNVTVTGSNAADIEEDKEEEIEIEREKIDYKGIVNTFNSVCVSFPSVKVISDARKKAIKARLKNYSVDDFRTLFEKAEASSFLKGKNISNWSATFDWLIKDSNMAKVLDGNYDDKKGAGGSGSDSRNPEKVYGEYL